jgi:hypothetical protein
MKIIKYIFFLLLTIGTFASCSKEISLEQIYMSYNKPIDGLIKAEGGEIVVDVTSTHSFQFSSPTPSIVSFINDGIVKYSQDGVAIVTTSHTIRIEPNETDTTREVIIYTKHLHNQDMASSLIFLQQSPLTNSDTTKDQSSAGKNI